MLGASLPARRASSPLDTPSRVCRCMFTIGTRIPATPLPQITYISYASPCVQSNPASPHPGPSPGPYSGPLTSHQCSLLPDGRPAYGPRCLPSQPWTRISRLNEAALGLSPRRAAPIAAPGGSAQAPARAGGPAPAGVGGVAGEHHIARIRSLAGALL